MKKTALALALALAFTVGASAQKFAHVDQAKIVQGMPEYTAAQTEIQTQMKQYEDELKRMQEELQTKLAAYEKESEKLPAAVKQHREQELQELNQRLQQYYQTSQEELEKLRNEKLAAIGEKVNKVIKEIGQAGGYIYVMDINSLPFINETISTDITSQVLGKLGVK